MDTEADDIQRKGKEYLQENELVSLNLHEWKGLPAILMTEHVTYGDIPAMSSVEKLVNIKNTSRNSAVRYSWECCYSAENSVHGHFSVMPAQGLIECDRSCVCKLTFTAGLQPQIFETTLRCRVVEVISQQASVKEEAMSAGDHQITNGESVLAEEQESMGSSTNHRNQRERRQSVVEKLTSSMKEKLPRLVSKPPLPMNLPRHQEHIKHASIERGTLYLSVSGSITPTDCLSKKLETPSGMQLQMDDSNGSDSRKMDVIMQIVITMFREAMQVRVRANLL